MYKEEEDSVMIIEPYYYILADLDVVPYPFPRQRYEAWAKERVRKLGNDILGFTYKRSPGGGIHVTAWLKNPISVDLVPVYQLAIGSDPRRECYNYIRFQHGVDLNVLFRWKKAVNIDWSIKTCSNPLRFMQRNCRGLLRLVDLFKKTLGLDLLEPPFPELL